MKAEAFLGILGQLMPTLNELRDYGLDDDEIEEIQRGFLAPQKAGIEDSFQEVGGEVGRLITGFDCSALEVGLVRFESEAKHGTKGILFGACEADPLFVLENGCVVMFDHVDLDAQPMVCAGSPDAFLDSLAVFAKIRSNKEEWEGRSIAAASECYQLSGHEDSLPFYRMLCGFLDM